MSNKTMQTLKNLVEAMLSDEEFVELSEFVRFHKEHSDKFSLDKLGSTLAESDRLTPLGEFVLTMTNILPMITIELNHRMAVKIICLSNEGSELGDGLLHMIEQFTGQVKANSRELHEELVKLRTLHDQLPPEFQHWGEG